MPGIPPVTFWDKTDPPLLSHSLSPDDALCLVPGGTILPARTNATRLSISLPLLNVFGTPVLTKLKWCSSKSSAHHPSTQDGDCAIELKSYELWDS